jgi:hypothetical protein
MIPDEFKMTGRFASMIRRHRYRRACHAFSIDFLESRALLNAALPSAPTAEIRTDAAASSLHVKLTGSDLYSSTYNLPGEMVLVYDVNAHGRVSKLGQVHLQASYSTDPDYAAVGPGHVFSIFQGTGTLRDSRGDQLFLTFSGSDIYQNRKDTFSLNGAVIGGSGLYANATGSLSANGKAPTPKTIQLELTLDL